MNGRRTVNTQRRIQLHQVLSATFRTAMPSDDIALCDLTSSSNGRALQATLWTGLQGLGEVVFLMKESDEAGQRFDVVPFVVLTGICLDRP